jgi:hypothetical protein
LAAVGQVIDQVRGGFSRSKNQGNAHADGFSWIKLPLFFGLKKPKEKI